MKLIIPLEELDRRVNPSILVSKLIGIVNGVIEHNNALGIIAVTAEPAEIKITLKTIWPYLPEEK